MNVARFVLDCVDRLGEYTAVYYEGASFTNLERLRFAERLAAVLLAYGVKPGDRVVVMMPNSPDVTSAFHAIWRIGAVIVPLPPQLLASEARFVITSSGAKFVLTCPELAERLKEATANLPGFRRLLVIGSATGSGAVDVRAELAAAEPIRTVYDAADDEVALLLYTSGTTGNPKGVMLTHNNLRSNALAVAALYHPPPQTMMLHVLPLSHSFGVLCMNLEAVFGSRSVILPRFDARRMLESIQQFRVKRFSAVPTVFIALSHYPERERYDCSSLDVVNSGGAALPEEVRLEFERLFHCRVLGGYGLSETAPTVSAHADTEECRPGSSGRPIPGVEVQITDETGWPLPTGQSGEICVRGPNVMTGYWNDPEATRKVMRDGWLRTGDVGHLDADDYLYITDRMKDIIIKGGENISPRQIEDAIHSHPAVAEVAVVGLPSKTFGEEVCAVIVLRAGHSATEAEIQEHTAHFVNKFRVPARVVIRGTLPKSGVGKILKRELRKELGAS